MFEEVRRRSGLRATGRLLLVMRDCHCAECCVLCVVGGLRIPLWEDRPGALGVRGSVCTYFCDTGSGSVAVAALHSRKLPSHFLALV